MASAWGDSWGSAWGDSWGAIGAVVARDRSDAGPRRDGPKRIIILPRPEPIAASLAATKPKRRKVTREAVEAAVAQPWAGLWTVPEAMAVLPAYVPITFAADGPSSEVLIQAIALQLAIEAERRAFEEDEEEVLMLLLAA